MWGWRVLSPGAPFTQGSAMASTRSFSSSCLMAKNEINANPIDGNALYSDYTAYGVSRENTRLACHGCVAPTDKPYREVKTFAEASTYLDESMALACENAKAAGITVVSILFRDDKRLCPAMMQNCASEGRFFFYASDAEALEGAFQSVAALLENLRLSR